MEQLIAYLESEGLRKSVFARRAGLPRPDISRYCSGNARPEYERAALIERVTGGAVPVSAWIRWDEVDAAERALCAEQERGAE